MRDVWTVLLYGVLEGVSEWLPISSTGHLILLDACLPLPFGAAGTQLFEVVIQLGAMLAVAVLYGRQLCPLGHNRAAACRLWGRVLIATLPAAAVGLLLDDVITRYLFTPTVVALMLVLYGVLLIHSAKWKNHTPFAGELEQMPIRNAVCIGFCQVAALIPGTSRSGATVLGGMLLGTSRKSAAEFSFFLGLPTMMGACALRCCKLFAGGYVLSGREWMLLGIGTFSAFAVSLAVMRLLMAAVRRHSFAPFGVYRIVLGCAVWLAQWHGIL